MTIGRRIALAGALFFASRLALLFLHRTDDTDLKLYAQYAMEFRYAERLQEPFYSYHARYMKAELAEWTRTGGPPLPEMVEEVEYPPLAIAWIVLPALFVGEPGADGTVSTALKEDYKTAYRWVMFVLDALLFGLLASLAHRSGRGLGLVLYAASGIALYHVLYERLDLVLGGLILVAIVLASKRVHHLWAFVALAVAIDFKVTPIVLAPLLVLASIPDSILAKLPSRELAKIAASRALLLATLTAGFMLPFYLASGTGALEFLGYHSERGLQIESAPSALILLLSFFGHDVEVVQGFGSYNISSSIAGFLAAASAPIVIALVGLATVQAHRCFVERAKAGIEDGRAEVLGLYAFATLAGAMIGSKVLSPQYMDWLAPLAPIALVQGRGRARIGLFLALCMLTTAIFPHFYPSDIARLVITPFNTPELLQPTSIGKLLILARNGILIALFAVLLRSKNVMRAE